MEDEFLWWQRRGLIALALAAFLYGLLEEPRLLLMTPILMLVVAFAVSRILRDASLTPNSDRKEKGE